MTGVSTDGSSFFEGSPPLFVRLGLFCPPTFFHKVKDQETTLEIPVTVTVTVAFSV